MALVQSRNDREVIIATTLASAMVFVDTSAVNTVMPAIQRSLGATITDAQWVLEIYTLILASLMLVGGALGDRFGRLRIFRLGVILFALASLACAMSQSALTLILARAFQGAAAALLTPASLALLNASFPPGRRPAAVGVWSAVTALAVPLGPVLGGALADWISWHWIFVINLPLSAFTIFAGRRLERPTFDPEVPAGFDWMGAIAITLSLGGLVFGMLEAPRLGFTHGWVVAAFVVSAFAFAAFVATEYLIKDPMLPLDLFRIRIFTGINLTTLLLYGSFHAAMFLVPFKFISAHGYSATQAGSALLPLTVGIFLLSRYSGFITDRIGQAPPVILGSVLASAGFLGIGLTPFGTDYLTGYLPFIVVLAIGLGFMVAPLTTIAVNAAGEGKSGIASSFNNTVVDVGALITVALAGLLLIPIYRDRLFEAFAGAGFSQDVARDIAGQAPQLGGIVLPQGADPALMRAALESSLGEVIAIAGCGGFLAAIVAAVMVWPVLPRSTTSE